MIGKTVSNYRITERIGSGAMGEVYRADDQQLKRPVALKFLSEELTRDERFKKRFTREAQAASALDHPNVCTIYQIGELEDGRLFIAMCYYEGKSLREHLKKGPLPLASSVAYAVGIADGLDRAHRGGILHRDIKPANIQITGEGIPKILDFGLAKLAGRSKVTKTGTSPGTLAYMSPEQVRGEQIDERSDIFSFGLVLYEMVTGTSPFIAENEAAIVYKVLNEDPPPPRNLRPDIPERLDQIIMRAISKERNDRFARMAELRDELLEVLGEIAPSKVALFESLRRSGIPRIKRKKKPFIVSTILIALIIATMLNWTDLRLLLGIENLGDAKGIIIFPFETASSHASEIDYGNGLMDLLAEGVQNLAELDSDLWIVPTHLVRKSGIQKYEQARGRFGIDAILTGKVTEIEESYQLTLQLLHATTLRPLDEITIMSTGVKDWQENLYSGLAAMLEVEIDTTRLQSIARGTTSNPKALDQYVIGLHHLSLDDSAEVRSAITAFTAALALDSTFADARIRCAEAALKLNAQQPDSTEIQQAISVCYRIFDSDSTLARALFIRGRLNSLQGNTDAAIKDLLHAARLRSRDPEIPRHLGNLYLNIGEYDNAELAYQTLCKQNPDYYGGYEHVGFIYYLLGRYEAAITQFERVAELAPDHAPTYNYLGASYYALDDWDNAIAFFEQSIGIGMNSDACTNLGLLYYMTGRFEDAVKMSEWAWENDQSNHLVLGNLAIAYYWIPGKQEHAIELFRQAIEIASRELAKKPDDAVLLSVMAGYYSLTDPDSAIAYAERALALDENNAEVVYNAALVYETFDNFARALVLLGDAIDKGYSLKEIEHERSLKELRADPRYKLLISRKEP